MIITRDKLATLNNFYLYSKGLYEVLHELQTKYISSEQGWVLSTFIRIILDKTGF